MKTSKPTTIHYQTIPGSIWASLLKASVQDLVESDKKTKKHELSLEDQK